ncbi:hypothetical protein EGR_04017 [Echinococcus granulosus]|uniref:Uncharacterized protein n=1 Tax=Echinococcus granulosus TaxID=6210 RepID=W6V4Q2_ECHGR|nr:hypothetical protein EGR_04017 [Echinococcus granulosus]EUB61169.1 hypothetical protein EGR_04017 [Echinococcus granulosus]
MSDSISLITLRTDEDFFSNYDEELGGLGALQYHLGKNKG